jgi:hypothetical protein
MLRSRVATKARNKASKRSAQVNAFEDLLSLRALNNNQLKRGDIKSIISDYHQQGLSCVTRQNLEYRFRLYSKGIHSLLSDNPTPTLVSNTIPPPVPFVEYDVISAQISGLTSPNSNNSHTNSNLDSNSVNDVAEEYNQVEINDDLNENEKTNKKCS